jgi:hypothetical protein
VRIDLEATLLNPKAFQVLRNMVSGLRRDGLFVNRMLVTDRKEPGAQEKLLHAANEDNEEETYPTLSSRVLVPPAWEDSDFKKMRRCLVELLRPPETAEVQKYIDWIKPWYAVLEAGGFSLPIGLPHETDCIRGPPAQFDELTIEIVVDRFFASECAWIVLANMLDGYSRTSIPLSRLIID